MGIPGWLLVGFDLILAIGATLRLTRFITTDDIPGEWWIKEPLDIAKYRWMQRHAIPTGRTDPHTGREYTRQHEPRWAKYLEGLDCPYCMSVWMAGFTTITLLIAGGPGDAGEWWRWIAGFLTLAWVVGHVAARAGDYPED